AGSRRRKPLARVASRGVRARARLWTKPCRMPISARLDFRPWSRVDSITNRTAVYGPVRTVVWEGRRSDPPPYPDQECLPHKTLLTSDVYRPGLRQVRGRVAHIDEVVAGRGLPAT